MPIAELVDPLVFLVTAAEIGSLVVFLHLGLVSLLSYQAVRAPRLATHAAWCFWASALTACFLALAFRLPVWGYLAALHGMSIAGPMAMRFYLRSVGTHLGVDDDPWLRLLIRWQPLVIAWPLLSMVSYSLGFGQFFLFERAAPPASLLLRLVDSMVPANEVHPVFALGLLAILVADVAVLMRCAMKAKRRDRWIVLGIGITGASVVYEVIAMKLGLAWAVPTIFAANLLEAVRISYASTIEVGRSKAALERRAAEMTHELRNPMASAQLFIDIARRRANGDRVVRPLEKAAMALDQANAVVTLRGSSEPGHGALTAVIDRALAICEPQLVGVTVVVDVDPGCRFYGSPSGLVQVFVNLIDNATRAAKRAPDPWIRIEATAEPGEGLDVRVIDAGMPPEEAVRRRLFEPSYSTQGHGHGVGLSLTRRIVDDLGGSLRLDSQAPTTTFAMRLPTSSQPPPADAAE